MRQERERERERREERERECRLRVLPDGWMLLLSVCRSMASFHKSYTFRDKCFLLLFILEKFQREREKERER